MCVTILGDQPTPSPSDLLVITSLLQAALFQPSLAQQDYFCIFPTIEHSKYLLNMKETVYFSRKTYTENICKEYEKHAYLSICTVYLKNNNN